MKEWPDWPMRGGMRRPPHIVSDTGVVPVQVPPIESPAIGKVWLRHRGGRACLYRSIYVKLCRFATGDFVQIIRWRFAMATFDQREQTVTYQYNAENINFGNVSHRIDFAQQVDGLTSELKRAEAL